MGFSVSASTAIIFAGLFLAFGTLYPAVSNGYEQVTDAEIDRDDAQLDMRNANINITQLDTTTINVTNEGSTSLDASAIDVVVDGEYKPRDSYDTEVEGNDTTELWLPGETLTVVPTDEAFDPSEGDQIKIVTDHGLSVTGEI